MSQGLDVLNTEVPNWNIHDLNSKPEEDKLLVPKNSDGFYLDYKGRPVSFKGNRALLPAHTKLALNEYHVKEVVKCREDVRYFIFNYCKVDVGGKILPPEFRSYQERYLKALLSKKRIVLMAGRQSGKTVTTALYLLWYIIFHRDKLIGIVANKHANAAEVLDKLKKIFVRLPIFLQQGVNSWNKGSIGLENGTRILTAATTGDAFRGFTLNKLYADEVSWVEENTWQEFSDSILPTVSAVEDSQVIFTSTPKGYNHFYKIWHDAIKGKSEFVPIKVEWNEVPGRDEEWLESQIGTYGTLYVNQNYLCKFLGSSETLISSEGLQKLTESIKEPIEVYDGYRIYEKPRKDKKYVITIDLADGTGFGDYTAVQIIKLNKRSFEQVAVFHSNNKPKLKMLPIIHHLAKLYNNAYVLFEINYGEEIASRLYNDIEYENVLTIANRDGNQRLLGFKGKFQLGLKTTQKTKSIMMITLKTLIESKKLIVRDKPTVDEFYTFVAKGGSYAAESNAHDDLVMSLGLFAWLVTQDAFKELSEYDAISEYINEAAKEEVLPPSLFGDHLAFQDEEEEGIHFYQPFYPE